MDPRQVPTDAILDLRQRLEQLPLQSDERCRLAQDTAQFYDVSESTLYLALRRVSRPRIKKSFLFASVVILLVNFGCIQYDPSTTVVILVEGANAFDEEEREYIRDAIAEGVDPGVPYQMSYWPEKDGMVFKISPVTNVETFVEGIYFGEVIEVDGRTVKVVPIN